MSTLLPPQEITVQYIQARYKSILAEVSCVTPLASWSVQPNGVFLTSHKSKYGWAKTDGTIEVNQWYLGTQAVNKLDMTIRHELAHLCRGLTHAHDRAWTRTAMLFGVRDDLVPVSEIEQIKSRIPYKYQVYANLANGERRALGGAHKKTKRYTEYNPNDRYKQMTIDRIRVLSFDFEEHEHHD
ncbi:hypothetical protein [Reinekea sp. G2M2-21]|uniref:hypothetical protein n=1 Tax=Reinekea sp. G2M2-21 TaxID=2788942 RepID=UPI0018AA3EB0|nr:hypothetical protein [Reinekea sp. G2M2-21]